MPLATGRLLTSYNPSIGEPIGEVRRFTADDAKEAIARARVTQTTWVAKSLDERGNVLRKLRQILLQRASEVCELLVMENGKPPQEAMLFEVMSIFDLIPYFIATGRRKSWAISGFPCTCSSIAAASSITGHAAWC